MILVQPPNPVASGPLEPPPQPPSPPVVTRLSERIEAANATSVALTVMRCRRGWWMCSTPLMSGSLLTGHGPGPIPTRTDMPRRSSECTRGAPIRPARHRMDVHDRVRQIRVLEIASRRRPVPPAVETRPRHVQDPAGHNLFTRRARRSSGARVPGIGYGTFRSRKSRIVCWNNSASSCCGE